MVSNELPIFMHRLPRNAQSSATQEEAGTAQQRSSWLLLEGSCLLSELADACRRVS